MERKQRSDFENTCIDIMFDAYELRARLPDIVSGGALSENQAKEIAHWLDNLKGHGVDRISPYFKDEGLWHPDEVNARFQDFSMAVNQLAGVLEQHMENSRVVWHFANKNTQKIIPEYEKRGLLHGFNERPPVPPLPDF
jgi:hypothetical protein